MKKNKLLTIDQLLTKELVVFMFKQKMVRTQLYLNIFSFKTNLNIISEKNQTLFQRCFRSVYTITVKSVEHKRI